MMMTRRFLNSFVRARDGATAVEFGIISFAFFLLICGIIEFSLVMFTASAIESATNIASRVGATGYVDPNEKDPSGKVLARKEYIRKLLKDRLGPLINADKIDITTTIYPDLSSPASGGPSDTGDVGRGGEIVDYTVSYTWPVYTPIVAQVAFPNGYRIVSHVIVNNEPFGNVPN